LVIIARFIAGEIRFMNVREACCAIGFAIALTATPAIAAQGDAAAGARKVDQCQGCHGIEGYRTGYPTVYHVPKLGGQHAAYIVKALQAYKSGERSFHTMGAMVANLSDQDMADIAAYYAGQTKPAAK
jgi:cytochrome c553